ncbi:Alb1-domain-containing protein [Triangularia verruculosa]|uniref:Alb1-domain-containing protein n=1 Tax=Triangularia verruculosa TaxID=2587418 RepID=A0AAN6XS96_9PEZI|nr:Alb1-domain-containing protein [Triangularia verruculosa]
MLHPCNVEHHDPTQEFKLGKKIPSIRKFRPPINTQISSSSPPRGFHLGCTSLLDLLQSSACPQSPKKMGKPTISKGKKGPSKHSRASRREEPIDINTDKSLKTALPPVVSTDHHRPAVLAAQLSSSVSKPSRKTGRKAQLSHKARKRQERAMDMAEAIMERTMTKVEKSLVHAKVINTRRKPWDEINNDVFGEEEKAKKLSKKQLEKQREDEIVRKFFEEGVVKDEDGNVEMDGASEEEAQPRIESAHAMEEEVL